MCLSFEGFVSLKYVIGILLGHGVMQAGFYCQEEFSIARTRSRMAEFVGGFSTFLLFCNMCSVLKTLDNAVKE